MDEKSGYCGDRSFSLAGDLPDQTGTVATKEKSPFKGSFALQEADGSRKSLNGKGQKPHRHNPLMEIVAIVPDQKNRFQTGKGTMSP